MILVDAINDTNSYINLHGVINQEYFITIYGVEGRERGNYRAITGDRLDVSGYESGIYFLYIVNGDEIYREKLIISDTGC